MGMIVNSHSESRKYYFVSMGTDCRLTIQASAAKDKIQFQFRFFLVYSLLRMSSNQNSGSASNKQTQSPGGPSVWQSHSRPVLSTGNFLTLTVTRGQQPRVDFVGDFTSFRVGFNTSECKSGPYFHCRNGKCIPPSLVCDSKNIDNCGDGSDQSPNPPGHCTGKGGSGTRNSGNLLLSTTTSSWVLEEITRNLSLDTGSNHKLQNPPGTERKSPPSLLYLYVILAVAVGVALLFWCCWSPGWFVWRISVCRFLPCCNSFCASCHLCTRSCVFKEKIRPGKVMPHSPATTVPV
ncbi:hypothetical protein GDO86_019023 [Hymenochirus boettgeri]|uniref:Low density lipoprotein receptor class A domain containing 2 n=1 Tax=Hymenochirus boettgeri TaxID=247094 RepID=A0A8T2IFC3_9PIPI|nr:hypothetical protein GDO86_019023 [Hymenochirus boettgeri]